MILLLSPAKSLDFDSTWKVAATTEPVFTDQAKTLAGQLRTFRPAELQQLMDISEKLAELNVQRFQDWEPASAANGGKPAALAFTGDVYQGLEAGRWTEKQWAFAQDHLRILSGLYGILRPADLILPYRLEMGTALQTSEGKNLVEFWGQQLTDCVNESIAQTNARFVLNLASNEYFRSVDPKRLATPVVSPVFQDFSGGRYKTISFYAKKARGRMASWVIRTRAKTLKKLRQFDADGYVYDAGAGSEHAPVFRRRQ